MNSTYSFRAFVLRFFFCACLVIPCAANQAGTKVRLFVEPASAEVGEPFDLVVEVEHDAAIVPVLPTESVADELDPSWVFFALVGEPSIALADDETRRITRRRWRLASLEPGERRLPSEFLASLVPAETSVVSGAATMVEIRGVLAEGEDAPRPLHGFPAGFGGDDATGAARSWMPYWIGALVLLGLLVAFWLGRRSTRSPQPGADESTPAQRLAVLEQAQTPAEGLQAAHFELGAIVRRAVDSRAGERRDGLTAEEWLSASQGDAAIAAELHGRLAELIVRIDRAKYAGERPSEWAWREELGHARDILAAVGKEQSA